VIQLLLKQLERTPNPVFSKTELLAISPHDFEDLKRRKILTYYRPPDDDMETVSQPCCHHGCTLTVQKFGQTYEAFCLNHPGEDAIPIGEDDLNRWCLSMIGLLGQLREANGLDGKAHEIIPDVHYVGYKHYGDTRVGFVFVSSRNDEHLLRLSGLRHLCKSDGALVVMTPTAKIEDVTLNAMLQQDRVVQTALASSLNPNTFVLNVEPVISGMVASSPPVTAEQNNDYDAFGYRCYDRVHIPGSDPATRGNIIVLAGSELRIEDSLFILFLCLVAELKKNDGGWVHRDTLAEEGVVHHEGAFQAFERLRKAVQGGLQGKNAKDFIENARSRGYRISTHPDFVTYDGAKLLNHDNARVRAIAGSLPQFEGRNGPSRSVDPEL
jgi:hypothetical protein